MMMEIEGKGEIDNEVLIILVQERPCLFDKTLKEYKDPDVKYRAWQEIANLFRVEVDSVTSRWRNLREKYAKERKEIKEKRSQGDSSPKSTWPYFHALEFLDPYILPRRSGSSALCNRTLVRSSPVDRLQEEEEDEKEVRELRDIRELRELEPPSSSSCKKLKKNENDLFITGFLALAETFRKKGERKVEQNQEETEEDIFGRSIAMELKKIKSRKAKRVIKSKIFNLIAELSSESD